MMGVKDMSQLKTISVAAITAFMSTQASAVDIGQELIYNGGFSIGPSLGYGGPPAGWKSEMYDLRGTDIGYPPGVEPFSRQPWGGLTDTYDPNTYKDPFLRWQPAYNIFQISDLQQRITAPAGTMVRVSYWVRALYDRPITLLASGFDTGPVQNAEPHYWEWVVTTADPNSLDYLKFVQTTYDYVLTEDNPYFYLMRNDPWDVGAIFDVDAISVVVIPTPGAASLLGVAGLMGMRRRR
jgi:hypothetical protein